MQASDRRRELERLYQQRKGHAQQPSISDDNYHVTEAIGDMYEDEPPAAASPEYLRQSRPLSFVPSPLGDTITGGDRRFAAQQRQSPPRPHLLRKGSSNEAVPNVNGANGEYRQGVMDGMDGTRREAGAVGMPPAMLNAPPNDPAQQPFEMNLDYTKPEDVAQELSNLQAIRRMSMDVGSQDPDLPSFNTSFRAPSLAPPAHGADDADPSRLFWVPARLHPELAPKEFKTFIEDRVKTIKRTSAGEEIAPDGLLRHDSSGGSLRRKKSMLSRQIDSGNNYEDGAVRLERNKSLSGGAEPGVGLRDLEELVNDPSAMARKISDEAQRSSLDSGIEMSRGEADMPMLPKAAGSTLKRSTRTQYRKGSLKAGEKLPFSKRLAARHSGEPPSEADSGRSTSPNPDVPSLPIMPLSRVQTEPAMSNASSERFDFSRPGRKRTAQATSPGLIGELDFGEGMGAEDHLTRDQPSSPPPDSDLRGFQSRTSSMGAGPVPQIVETPPPQEAPYAPSAPVQHPERKSSRSTQPAPEPPPSLPPQQPLPNRPKLQQPPRPPLQRQGSPSQPVPENRTLGDMAAHPAPFPGTNSRTDTLSFIPTLQEEKKVEKKKSKEESRKPSWGWLRSKEEKEPGEKEDTGLAKKAKAKLIKPADESSSGRLDVLQQSIDAAGAGRPRESLVLDRSSILIADDGRNGAGSNRKSTDSSKKEKDGIFSSLFSKKRDKDGAGKSGKHRGLSPDPPPRILKPDVDYNWTRFSIMEERAIYRMAHIKLANPRRELYSQVLLSNFMYSYLAKVQSQHPQLQVAQKAQQQQQQQQQRGGQQKKESPQQQSQQPEEYAQYQRYQEQQQTQQSQQPDTSQYHSQQQQQSQQQYLASSQPSEPPDDDGGGDLRPDSRVSQHSQHQQQQYAVQYSSGHQGYANGGGYGGSGYGGGGGGPVNYPGHHGNGHHQSEVEESGMWT